MITALRSRLQSRAAPPVLNLDTIKVQEEPPRGAASPPSSPGAPVQSHLLSPHQDSPQQWSLFTALTEEIQKFQEDAVTGDALQSAETSSSTPADGPQSPNTEDFIFGGNTDRTSSKSTATPVGQPTAEGTSDPRQAVRTLKTRSLHRKYRSLLHKRQIPGASGKSMYHTLKPSYTPSLYASLCKVFPGFAFLTFGQLNC